MTFKELSKCLIFKRVTPILFLTFALFLYTDSAYSQVKGGEAVEKKEHSPRKATILSAVLPGLGQAYNKKYWKIPVIYAGAAVSAYVIVFNDREYNKFRDEFIVRQNNNGVGSPELSIYSSNTQIRQIMDLHKKRRDWGIAAAFFIYALNIIDANVDGHLFDFNVSPDLSMRVVPYFDRSIVGSTGFSFSMRF